MFKNTDCIALDIFKEFCVNSNHDLIRLKPLSYERYLIRESSFPDNAVHLQKLGIQQNIQLHSGLSPYLTHSVISTVADPGGGSRGSRPHPRIKCDTCLRLKFLNRQGHISLFNWLILFNEMCIAFCH